MKTKYFEISESVEDCAKIADCYIGARVYELDVDEGEEAECIGRLEKELNGMFLVKQYDKSGDFTFIRTESIFIKVSCHENYDYPKAWAYGLDIYRHETGLCFENYGKIIVHEDEWL